MRIGIFIELYRPYLSGVVVSIELLAKELLERGHQVFILTPEVQGYKDTSDFKVVRLPSFRFFGKRFAVPFLSKRVKKKVKELDLDLIHIQGPYPTGFLGIKLAQGLGLPILMTYHAHVLFYLKTWANIWNWPLSFIARIMTLWIIRWTSKHCQLIIAPSHFIKNVLRGYGIKTQIEVLPTGIKPFSLKSAPLSRSQLGLPREGKILIYVGRLAKEKNLKMLILAFEEVLKARKDVFLVLVGDGHFRPILEKTVKRKKLEDWVFFLGEKPHGEIGSILKVSDVFAFSSLSETQGLAVAEAMAVGLPVVVVGEGGALEFIDNKENGLVVPNLPKEFASAILSIIGSSDLASFLGQNAQKKVIALRPEVVYQEIEGLYSQLTKEFIPVRK